MTTSPSPGRFLSCVQQGQASQVGDWKGGGGRGGRASPVVQSISPSRNAMEAGGPTERTTLGLKENQCLWPWGRGAGGTGGTLTHQCLEFRSRTNCSRSAVVLGAGSTAGPLRGGEGVARRPWQN